MAKRRDYGTGGVKVIGPSWYGRWYDADGNRIQRKLGKARTEGSADGLTKAMAEEKLREMRAQTGRLVGLEGRVTMQQAGEQFCLRLALRDRKKSHQMTVASDLRNHIVPFFDKTTLEKITTADVERYVLAKKNGVGGKKKLASKTISNHLTTIHSVFELGVREGWCVVNPVKHADRPKIRKNRTRIRFLTTAEVDELVQTPFPGDAWGRIEPTLYLTAAMTGIRQSELIALRWRDIDFGAQRIRVVEGYVRGEFNDPKSEESSRSVPMSTRVAQALSDLSETTKFPRTGDLVFCHPDTGNPLDRSKLIRRLKQALHRSNLREVTFHELRHTFGTTMASAGVPRRTIQEWMGHEDGDTTEVYMHYAPRDDEVQIVDEAFA
jgi:integrase